MDNAAFHKNNKTQKVIKNSGHTLEYLPPYSPDPNAIEHKWAQAKAIRKKITALSMRFLPNMIFESI